MIRMGTILNVACNSGVELVKCFGVNGSTGDFVASVGDVVIVSVRKVKPNLKVKKGDKHYGVIVRTKNKVMRSDGSFVSFSDNAVVLIDNKTMEPLATRVFGPVAREVKDDFPKIASLAVEVL